MWRSKPSKKSGYMQTAWIKSRSRIQKSQSKKFQYSLFYKLQIWHLTTAKLKHIVPYRQRQENPPRIFTFEHGECWSLTSNCSSHICFKWHVTFNFSTTVFYSSFHLQWKKASQYFVREKKQMLGEKIFSTQINLYSFQLFKLMYIKLHLVLTLFKIIQTWNFNFNV